MGVEQTLDRKVMQPRSCLRASTVTTLRNWSHYRGLNAIMELLVEPLPLMGAVLD